MTHRTACGHYIHDRCLEPWLRRSDRCPVCRAQLPLTCHASWTHNQAAEGQLAQVPQYLCNRSSYMINIYDSTGDETETESDSDDAGDAAVDRIRAAMREAMADVGANQASEESAAQSAGESADESTEAAEEEEEVYWNAQNRITIHAHGRARVTLRIGSENR